MFKWGKFTSHSGLALDWKVECDSLTDEDWACIAELIASRVKFRRVFGIPTGADKLAALLQSRCDGNARDILIVDDVLTTGDSLRQMRQKLRDEGEANIVGIVLYARGPCPWWVTPIFGLTYVFCDAAVGVG